MLVAVWAIMPDTDGFVMQRRWNGPAAGNPGEVQWLLGGPEGYPGDGQS